MNNNKSINPQDKIPLSPLVRQSYQHFSGFSGIWDRREARAREIRKVLGDQHLEPIFTHAIEVCFRESKERSCLHWQQTKEMRDLSMDECQRARGLAVLFYSDCIEPAVLELSSDLSSHFFRNWNMYSRFGYPDIESYILVRCNDLVCKLTAWDYSGGWLAEFYRRFSWEKDRIDENARTTFLFQLAVLSLDHLWEEKSIHKIQFVRAKELPNLEDENRFIKEGKFWAISYEGGSLPKLRDQLGFNYLSYLLQGSEFKSPLEVLSVARTRALDSGADPSLDTDDKDSFRSPDPDSYIDDKAKKEYSARLEQIKAEKEAARDRQDWEKFERLENEEDNINSELKTKLNRFGRPRQFSNKEESARKSVSNRIKAALEKIHSHNEALYNHLNATILPIKYPFKYKASINWIVRR